MRHLSSVDRRGRKLGLRNTNAAVRAVEHGVETLEEGLTVDEVEALATVSPYVSDDEVNAVRVSPDRTVERTLQWVVGSVSS